MKPTILISFSGGRTSAMMTKYLFDNFSKTHNLKPVFSNTGHEKQATLDFVKQCDDYFGFNTVWIEPVITDKGTKCKIVDYESAYCNYKKNGIDPFEQMIAKYGIPNMANPHCSRELKRSAIRAYARDFEGHKKIDYQSAIGFRSDEPKRLNWEKSKKDKLLYFAQLVKVTKSDVNKFWSNMPFDLQLKSYEGNCILCWKKSNRKLYTIVSEGIINNDIELLSEIEWLKHIELKYGKYVPESRAKQDKGEQNVMFRKKQSIEDIISGAEILDLSEYAIDESNLIDVSLQLSLFSEELDSNFGCTESCEPF
jgi:hypothetical protein